MKLWVDRHFLSLYLIALTLIGLGYISILPIFEGFDETAHFSRLREIAYSEKLKYTSSIDQSVLDYKGPMPYGTGYPPYDTGEVYPKFFASQNSLDFFYENYRKGSLNHHFLPSNEFNWQYQHPPLYYLITAPILSLTDNFSFVTQFFAIRFFSYLIALFGVFFAMKTLLTTKAFRSVIDQSEFFKFSALIYPLIFPEFFFEFARVGNDSLCLLLNGLLFYVLLKWLPDCFDIKKSIFIGVILGIGMLTKAFFIPIGIAVTLFIFLHFLYNDFFKKEFLPAIKIFAAVFIPALMIAGGWYLMKYLVSGDFGGGFEANQLQHNVGFMNGFKRNLSFGGLTHGILMPLATFFWIGSWSVVRMPVTIYLILVLSGLWIFWNFVINLKKISIFNFNWLIVWLLLLMLLGLFWHVLVMVALNGYGASGGHYLHILFPWFIPAIALGVMRIFKNNRQRFIFILLIACAAVFQFIAIWFHMALFSGCAAKGEDKYFVFNSNSFCLDQVPLVMSRLKVLSFPELGVVFFLLGFGLLGYLIAREIQIKFISRN